MRFLAFLLATMTAACGTVAPEADSPSAAPRTGGATVPAESPATADAEPRDAEESPPRYVQAGAPGEESRALTPDEMATLGVPDHSDADVRFVQGMIPHHAQAIEMVALMAERTSNERLLRLGQRIEISQRDEIAMMARWLRERGEVVPDLAHPMAPGGHGGMHGALVPGMLKPEQMEQLASADGADFDRLFLELMIAHHEGALIMVGELFSTPGGGQESWTFQFASDVDADQEMEIRRMRQMLNEMR